MVKFVDVILVLIPLLLFFNITIFNFAFFISGLILILLSLYFLSKSKKILSFLYLGLSEVFLISSFTAHDYSFIFISGYLFVIMIFKIWNVDIDSVKDELNKTSFMQNNPEEVARSMFKQIEKRIGKSYIELSYMGYLYKNEDIKLFDSVKHYSKTYSINIFDKNIGYLKIIPLKRVRFLQSVFIKQTLDITTYWLMNVTFLNSITLLESLENFASRNDYGIIIENKGNFLYTNKYIQKNFPYIHNLNDLVSIISDKYKNNLKNLLQNEGNDIFLIKKDNIELFVGIGIEKSDRTIGELNIIKISPITSSNVNEILLYKFDNVKFRELVSSLHIISTMEDKDKAFEEIINIIKSKISNAKNMFIFTKKENKFVIRGSDVIDKKNIFIEESEIPDIIGPWYTRSLVLKSRQMTKCLQNVNAIVTKFSDGDELEGLLILTLNENSNIDQLDISIINIIIQYINIALINIITIHKLSRVAKYDGLTGLLRRETFEDMFTHILEMSKRANKTFSLVYVDMDKLKFINDEHGHQYGDMALKILADTLKHNVRTSDLCARVGGDEFIVLLNDTDDPKIFIDRVKSSLSSKILPEINLTISATFGYYVYDGKEENPEKIISIADQKMYENKKKRENS